VLLWVVEVCLQKGECIFILEGLSFLSACLSYALKNNYVI